MKDQDQESGEGKAVTQSRPFCFVVMGFGVKTDFESGRTLDLDATYEAIIEPAVTEAGLRCMRADEFVHSGVIDRKMYEALYRADLVVADISTGNINAVYELGVRHALRPYSTITMKESEGRLHFDLDHVVTMQYEHLGADIGAREAGRAKNRLAKLVRKIMAEKDADSPVYQFLPGLQQPKMSAEEVDAMVDERETHEERLSTLVRRGRDASSASRHNDAAEAFGKAHELSRDDPYIVQQWALATYKAKLPSEETALLAGLEIIDALKPEESNDPETLGIAGAMHKRLWMLKSERGSLDKAIRCYRRGFDVRGDYYNGENLATCLDYRSRVQDEAQEDDYDRKTASKVRESIVENLQKEMEKASFGDRMDRKWVFATLANCYFALGNDAAGNRYEGRFRQEHPAEWELETYESGKLAALQHA